MSSISLLLMATKAEDSRAQTKFDIRNKVLQFTSYAFKIGGGGDEKKLVYFCCQFIYYKSSVRRTCASQQKKNSACEST